MKRSKSGAQKRKEAATARDAVAKLPKMTDFFKITEQSRPGTSTERDEENYSVQEKEDYDDQHQSDCEFPENVSCDLPANMQPSISKITESQFIPIPNFCWRRFGLFRHSLLCKLQLKMTICKERKSFIGVD